MIKVVPLRYFHYCFDTNTAATAPKLNFWCDRQQSGFNSFRSPSLLVPTQRERGQSEYGVNCDRTLD